MIAADVWWLPAAVAGAVGLAAAAQVLSGLGFALVAGPFLILALGQGDGVRLSVAMSLMLNIALLVGSYRFVRWADALRLLVPATLLVLPTVALTTRLSAPWVSAAAGAAILVAVALIALGRRANWVDRPVGALAAGASSGVLNVLAGASGPPVALFVAHRGWAPQVSSATLQAYALPLNVVTLAALGAPSAQPARLLWACVGLIVGAASAWRLRDRVSSSAVRTLTLILATAGGLLLLYRGLL